ncbi:MAG: NTP transferase domain-containing protein [Patescibacteria group bacterium]|nr:NTP transferase domain-containing protein [Patescibacteria group bacterium]
MRKKVSAVVLAGGYGYFGVGKIRMSKVVAKIGGKPMVRHVMETLRSTEIFARYHVVANKNYARQIENALQGLPDTSYQIQECRIGSAGAVELALKAARPEEENVLITYADMPLWEPATYAAVAERHLRENPDLTLVSIPLKPGTRPERYGRFLYGPDGELLGTIDDPACVPEGKYTLANEVNPSLYAGKTEWLKRAISEIPLYDKKDGFPPERLMQSVIYLAYRDKRKVVKIRVEDCEQAYGVNTKEELREVKKIFALRRSPAVLAA